MACIDFHQPGSVGEGSDHLQLITFWPSCALGKGSAARRGEILWLRVTTASAQCLRLSKRFFSFYMYLKLSYCNWGRDNVRTFCYWNFRDTCSIMQHNLETKLSLFSRNSCKIIIYGRQAVSHQYGPHSDHLL